MGVAITELLQPREIEFDELKNKVIAVDAFNILYQFLTTIRQADGTPLKNSKGQVTSHLTGLFTRTSNLMSRGIKLVFVFDGKPPEMKKEERLKRDLLKKEAQKKYDVAKQNQDVDEMKKYSQRTTKLTPEMADEAKKLLQLMGLPVIQAPSEGEAQAAYMVKKEDIYALVSQDIDALLFGSPLLIRNLTITARRKVAGKLSYAQAKPEIVSLSETLNTLGLEHDQLIALGMLVGTDYNVGGIKGLGPKKALKIVKEHGKDLDSLFKEVKWEDYFSFSWQSVFQFFKEVPVTDE